MGESLKNSRTCLSSFTLKPKGKKMRNFMFPKENKCYFRTIKIFWNFDFFKKKIFYFFW